MSERALRDAARYARKLLKADRRVLFDCSKEPDGKVREKGALQGLRDYDIAIDKIDRALAAKP